jgi:hypothetical protein
MSVQTVYQLSFNFGWLKTNLDPSGTLTLFSTRRGQYSVCELRKPQGIMISI